MSILKKRVIGLICIVSIVIVFLSILFVCYTPGEYSERIFFVDQRCKVIEVKNTQPKDSGIVVVQIKIFIDEENMPILEAADLAKLTIDTYIKSNKVNGVTVCAFRKEDKEIDTTDTNNAFVIMQYAPQGNMLLAGTVEAGDYSTFEYKRLW